MKLLKQLLIILAVALAGEALSALIPLPIPASIYGVILMLALLISGLLKVEQVKTVSSFLVEIMPVMFVPAAVGLMQSYHLLAPSFGAYAVITVVSTIAVMVVSGRVTQHVIQNKNKNKNEDASDV